MLDTNTFYSEVGQKIKKMREARSITQEVLASKVSLTRTSITNIEKGRQKFLLHTLVEIATVLGVNTPSLLPQFYGQNTDALDERLKGLPPDERDWIKTTVESATTGT